VESLSARANVDDPRNPAGSLQLDLTKLTAAGFQFDTVRAQGERAPKSHRLALRVSGSRWHSIWTAGCAHARKVGPDRCRAS
jgi:hypothetical protein